MREKKSRRNGKKGASEKLSIFQHIETGEGRQVPQRQSELDPVGSLTKKEESGDG